VIPEKGVFINETAALPVDTHTTYNFYSFSGFLWCVCVLASNIIDEAASPTLDGYSLPY